jgi:leucyl aminopeptidase
MERACRASACRRVALDAGADLDLALDLLEGMALRAYAFDECSEPDAGLRQVTWTVAKSDKAEAKQRLASLQAKLEGMQLARTLSDLPPNLGTPELIIERVVTRVEAVGLQVDSLGRAELEELEMGLFCAIARGSSRESKLLLLEHRPEGVDENAAPDLALVGKGVTLDAGGYNLKSSGIHEMNYDKAGAAAVIGAMLAIAHAKLPVHVVAACPLAENVLGPDAIRPGAIVRAFDGRTVYIENVDAEGRLLMADTLAWLTEREPQRVIDLATLTGAAHTALGEPFAALFSNDDTLRDELISAGLRADERLWPMPIDDLHDRELAHPRADLRNVGAYAGGASAAAAFLRYFVTGAWAHIDLAGKGAAAFERDYMGAGASGFGTRLLFEYVQALAER